MPRRRRQYFNSNLMSSSSLDFYGRGLSTKDAVKAQKARQQAQKSSKKAQSIYQRITQYTFPRMMAVLLSVFVLSLSTPYVKKLWNFIQTRGRSIKSFLQLNPPPPTVAEQIVNTLDSSTRSIANELLRTGVTTLVIFAVSYALYAMYQHVTTTEYYRCAAQIADKLISTPMVPILRRQYPDTKSTYTKNMRLAMRLDNQQILIFKLSNALKTREPMLYNDTIPKLTCTITYGNNNVYVWSWTMMPAENDRKTRLQSLCSNIIPKIDETTNKMQADLHEYMSTTLPSEVNMKLDVQIDR